MQGVFLDVVCPGDKVIDLSKNLFDFLIGEERRFGEVVGGKSKVRSGTFPAVRFCLAELTPFAAMELALALEGKLGGRNQYGFCPFEKFGGRNGVGADVGAAGLVDSHRDRIDVVESIEDFQSAECIQHHLWVVVCGDLHALAVLVIHDVEGAVSDEDAVPGAESALDVFGIVEPLFNQHDGVGRDLLRFGEEFKHIGGITAGTLLHLLVVPGEVFGGVFGRNAQSRLELVFAQTVGIRTFGGEVAALVLVVLTEPCGRRAVQPPMGRGSGKQSVITHLPSPPRP